MGALIFSLVYLVDLVHPPSETLFCFLAFAVVAKSDVVIYERDFIAFHTSKLLSDFLKTLIMLISGADILHGSKFKVIQNLNKSH